MRLKDVLDLAVGNLWRIKLRAFLTISGVVIAIATFVAMMSFAAGNQKYFADAYRELGLMTTINVYPRNQADNDSTEARVLDAGAVQQLGRIPGVELAFPFVSFDVTVAVADTQFKTVARAMTNEALTTPMYSSLLGGHTFTDSIAKEAIVSHGFLESAGLTAPDSLVGKQIVISMEVAKLDSALFHALGSDNQLMRSLARRVRFDSLASPGYRRRVARDELSAGFGRFMKGLLAHQAIVSDTLTVKGVGPEFPSYRLRMVPVTIPVHTARRLNSGGVNLGNDPAGMLTLLRSGKLFEPEQADSARSYPRVTLETGPLTSHSAVIDSVKALGFRAFSYAEQFGNMKRFMIYYYAGLGIIGLIALVTASMGIINTMVMSITERRREIGILKSLGAGERVIRHLYLMESAAIGTVGATLGILLGYLGTRIVSMIMKTIMEREDMVVFEPFALPIWLVLIAFLFGVLISLAAGLYPAARAASVDPIEALRSE